MCVHAVFEPSQPLGHSRPGTGRHGVARQCCGKACCWQLCCRKHIIKISAKVPAPRETFREVTPLCPWWPPSAPQTPCLRTASITPWATPKASLGPPCLALNTSCSTSDVDARYRVCAGPATVWGSPHRARHRTQDSRRENPVSWVRAQGREGSLTLASSKMGVRRGVQGLGGERPGAHGLQLCGEAALSCWSQLRMDLATAH